MNIHGLAGISLFLLNKQQIVLIGCSKLQKQKSSHNTHFEVFSVQKCTIFRSTTTKPPDLRGLFYKLYLTILTLSPLERLPILYRFVALKDTNQNSAEEPLESDRAVCIACLGSTVRVHHRCAAECRFVGWKSRC